MSANNERNVDKAVVAAFGGTGPTSNERHYWARLIAAITGSNVKTKPAVVALVALTNSTGGTANDTVQAVTQATAAVTDITAASLTSTNAALTLVNNDIADLTVKVNAIIAALKA